MSNIILPTEEVQPQESDTLEYQATEDDEEKFFCIYHMNMQPSEADALSASYRKWLIMRFIAQKNLEKEAMQQHRLMQSIGSNLKV